MSPAVLIPIYNDWEVVGRLLGRLDDALQASGESAEVLLVDDGSIDPPPGTVGPSVTTAISAVRVLRLRRNLGHQRAIAIGLMYLLEKTDAEYVVVMDGDGEDDPADVPRLLARARQEGGESVIFAERTRRSENLSFQVLYHVYRWLHLVLTGLRVRVGNFSVVPRPCLERLGVVSEIWSHYAAAVFKARIPNASIPTVRARRLGGRSKMRFVGLVTHGLTALSIYGETIGVRLLIVLVVLLLLVIGSGFAGLWWLSGDLLGWSLLVLAFLVLFVLQAVGMAMVFVIFILAGRQGTAFLPIRDYKHFILSVR
jgi:glycosyltransferase involved in cell wall biosynthesis